MWASLSDLAANRIYAGSIFYDLTESDMLMAFSPFGQIMKIDMPKVRHDTCPVLLPSFSSLSVFLPSLWMYYEEVEKSALPRVHRDDHAGPLSSHLLDMLSGSIGSLSHYLILRHSGTSIPWCTAQGMEVLCT